MRVDYWSGGRGSVWPLIDAFCAPSTTNLKLPSTRSQTGGNLADPHFEKCVNIGPELAECHALGLEELGQFHIIADARARDERRCSAYQPAAANKTRTRSSKG
jgi:hypothetical protein